MHTQPCNPRSLQKKTAVEVEVDNTNPVLKHSYPRLSLKKEKDTLSPVLFFLSFCWADESKRGSNTSRWFSSSRLEFKSSAFIARDYGCMTFRALSLVESCSCWAPIRKRISAMLETFFVTAADTWRCKQDSVRLWAKFCVWWSHKAPIQLQRVFETYLVASMSVFIFSSPSWY